MTKGRAVLPLSVVAEQKLFFITLGGPKAHDFSGRDDKGEGGASSESSCLTDVFDPLGWVDDHDSSGRDDKGRGMALPETEALFHQGGPRAHDSSRENHLRA